MSKKITITTIAMITIVVFGAHYFLPSKNIYEPDVLPIISPLTHNEALALSAGEVLSENQQGVALANEIEVKEKFTATHIKTPEPLKAIYMSSWVAGTPSFRSRLVSLIDETELNAVVIDIKDYSGKVSFLIEEEPFLSLKSSERRISDVKEFIKTLHDKNIYVIGRISVFQDPHLTSIWPGEAVKKSSDKEAIWKDHKGLGWVDPGSEKVWQYHVDLAKIAYEHGFDEINFDYIRFPSDGNMRDIYYPVSEGRVKKDVMREFFEYLDDNLRSGHEDDRMKISADLFGMVTTNTDDLGIGQLLEDGLKHFDYVAPMVYPSHFPNNWAGMSKPAEKPYDVIHRSMLRAFERAVAMGEDPLKLRPWLQDFNLGATYTKELVRAQIDATYDVGLTSWMLWDPKNIYTRGALKTMLELEASNFTDLE
jgi:hypothetical protein